MYGYKIVDGKVIVDEQEAAVVINIFNGYLSGMSLRDAATNAGRPMVHSMVKRMIRNVCYVGDDFLREYSETHTVPYGFFNTAPGKGHLNRTGHRILAEALYRKLKEEGL